jgi:type IV secretory pathway VirB2 component (pilin)
MSDIDPRAGADPVPVTVAVAVALAAVALVGLVVLVGESGWVRALMLVGEAE